MDANPRNLPRWMDPLTLSVKEMTLGASIPLTTQGHKVNGTVDQALVGAIKPNLISDLIQRGALR